jgi:hypothetical protein
MKLGRVDGHQTEGLRTRLGRGSGAMAWVLLALCIMMAIPALAGRPRPKTVTVDVMVFYTPGAAALYGGAGVQARIQHLINVTNDAMTNSVTRAQIRLVHTQQVAYSDTADTGTALDDFQQNVGVFQGVESLRTIHGADLAILLRPYVGDGICGQAYMNTFPPAFEEFFAVWAYSHTSIDCPDLTLAHELGHNLGLSHSRRQDGVGGILPHALGYGVDFTFVTTMAYPESFNAPTLPLYSNPALDCVGLPCGIPEGQPDSADAAAAIRAKGSLAASYRP